ncbi:MAG: oligosaccharide flippase family protein [Clostridia bacterium]|nr:oligosaccharide flippase family protein [Clostridia bacterium]
MVNQRRAGALLSYIYIAVNSLIALIYLPIVKRALGTSEFGLYELAASIINYMSVMDLGFGNGIVVFTSKYRAAERFEEEKKLHGMFSLIFKVIGVAAVIFGLVITLFTGSIFGNSLTAEELPKARIIMAIITANLGLTFPLSMYGSVVIAHEKFVFSKILVILKAVLNPLIMLPILILGADSIAMVSVMTVISVACNFSAYFYCKKRLGVSGKFIGFDKRIFKEVASYSAFIFIAEIVDKVNWSVDHIILGIAKGTTEVTVYGMASNYNQLVLQLSSALSGVMLPKISRMVEKKEGDSALNREFIKTSRLQFFLIFLVTCGFVMFGHKFVIIHSGADCETSYYVAVILIVASLIPITQSVAISIVKAKNLFRFRAFTILGMAIANIGISIPLAIKYGSVGSAIGTASALVFANIAILNVYYSKKCGIDIKGYWKNIGVMALKFIPSIAVSLTLKLLFPLKGLFELLAYGSVFVLLYSLTSYFFVMNDYEKGLVKKYAGKLIPALGKKK